MIDVGQGDSIFIDIGGYEALVDAGMVDAGISVVKWIEPYVDGSLDLLIATHPDKDHIGGLPYVLSAFQVDKVIESGYVKATDTYNLYRQAVDEEPGCIVQTDDNMNIPLGGAAVLRIIETGDDWDNVNDGSVICELVCGNNKVLLTGDMSAAAERENLSLFEDVDILKVGHHGSKYSSSKAFLDIIKPEYAIISCGLNNSYGHPAEEALQRLLDSNAVVYGTFRDSTVSVLMSADTFSFIGNYTPLSLTDAGANGATADNGQEVYYIGNSNTLTYHRPDCSSVQKMAEGNGVHFISKTTAESAGYKACGKCRP